VIAEGQALNYPKACRIHLKKDFEYLRERSKKNFVPPLVVYTKTSRLELPHARLGLSVSSKQGNAVRRNRIKRILREEFRRNSKRAQLNLDILVVTAQKVEDEAKLRDSFKQIMDSLISAP
jgi:ribonuclease P protein component